MVMLWGRSAGSEVEVVIVGGGIAGLSTAYALHERGVSCVVIERGLVCGQGATAAAQHGHVYAPDGEADALRSESLEIYKRLEDEHGVGLEVKGAATICEDGRETELFAVYNSIASHPLPGTRFVASQEGIYSSASGVAVDSGAASAEPCRVLEAMRRRAVVWERSEVFRLERKAHRWEVGVDRNGSRVVVKPRAIVLALGIWRNEFSRQHLPGLATRDVFAVAGQTATYRVDRNVSGMSVFYYGRGSLAKKLAASSYFLTHDIDGKVRATYAYAKARGNLLAVGTRRQPLASPEACDALQFDDDLHAAATRSVFRALGVSDNNDNNRAVIHRDVACFPVISPSGTVRAARLETRLYELNGLAGGGIARAPAAAARLADLITTDLRGACGLDDEEARPLPAKNRTKRDGDESSLARLVSRASALRAELGVKEDPRGVR
ncbi:hypothetical protein CTAYLR_005099 [Chrysophaeum taylorii]|uniref:FAD dependent oxidoreductase domain-containing protein n=1 Tax=Chrysophaeum taylorii TaxID=2483200 RepID=A0AAD7XM50_9STRA|nr:hypothetical protein CTAYLR_005099 [Chrysophaeum taylorii]